MDSIDKKILNIIQRHFPITAQPYAAIAEDLGLSEQEVLNRIEALTQQKIIRKIGASIAPRKINHTTTLVAAKVVPEKLDEVANAVSSYPQVTHNYGRKHEFNLWFTLVGHNQEDIKRLCDEISKVNGIIELLELPTTHLFKLDVFFDFTEEAKK